MPPADNSVSLFYRLRYNLVFYWINVMSLLADIIYRSCNRIKEYPRRDGEVAIVTGGARGIGSEVVRGLLKCGMHVVLGVRDPEAGKIIIDEFKKLGYRGSASTMRLDVASLKSIERFTKEFKARHAKLHLLVNNAGVVFQPHALTEDGFESTLATNYLGHFYLTHLLMDRMIAAGDQNKVARVVNVASCAHFGIHMFFEDFNMERHYHPVAAYARSKMAQILSTRYLDSMFASKHLPVRMYAVHPGIVATGMFYRHDDTQYIRFVGGALKSPAEGAASVLHAAISPTMETEGGTYTSNCISGYADEYSTRRDNQERLYHVTRKVLDVTEFGSAKAVE